MITMITLYFYANDASRGADKGWLTENNDEYITNTDTTNNNDEYITNTDITNNDEYITNSQYEQRTQRILLKFCAMMITSK
jgi:hypothetical protein